MNGEDDHVTGTPKRMDPSELSSDRGIIRLPTASTRCAMPLPRNNLYGWARRSGFTLAQVYTLVRFGLASATEIENLRNPSTVSCATIVTCFSFFLDTVVNAVRDGSA